MIFAEGGLELVKSNRLGQNKDTSWILMPFTLDGPLVVKRPAMINLRKECKFECYPPQ